MADDRVQRGTQSDPFYRPDIDGLRGVAVLFVLAFHGSAGLLPGGFVGVDIFFVISGYLISSIIFKDLARERFTIHGFYARRIKRIFPALIIVLGATCVLGWLVLFPAEFQNLGKHVVGGAAFISNILLWRETGYFNDAAESKPLLHLWSLGIEEQFYMFFPVLLWFAYRRGFATPRFLAGLLGVSFCLSLAGTIFRPVATFYLPVTRLWELLLGCTLAAAEQRSSRLSAECSGKPADVWGWADSKTHLVASNACAWLGFVMILGGAVYLNSTRAFPGGWALLPTVGTALVIWAGKNAPVNRRFFSNKVLVAVGLISYPLYLWHWPLLYFGRILSSGKMSSLVVAGILAAAVLLAALTYRLIECPIRFGGMFGKRKVFALSAAMAGVVVFGVLATGHVVPSRLGLNPLSSEAGNAAEEWFYPFPDNFKLLSGFRKDAEIVSGKSGQGILFIGDSHMQHYWPRIAEVTNALQDKCRPIFLVTSGGCPALPNVNRVDPGYACERFFEFAMQEASRSNITTVVFSCFWEHYFLGRYPDGQPAEICQAGDTARVPLRIGNPGAAQVFTDFGHAIAALTGMGKEVFVILPSPTCTAWSPKALSRTGSHATLTNQVRVGRKEFEAFVRPVKQALVDAVLAHGGKTIDPLDYIEEEGFLNGKTPEGRFRYRDADHFRAFYVRETALFLDPLLRAK